MALLVGVELRDVIRVGRWRRPQCVRLSSSRTSRTPRPHSLAASSIRIWPTGRLVHISGCIARETPWVTRGWCENACLPIRARTAHPLRPAPHRLHPSSRYSCLLSLSRHHHPRRASGAVVLHTTDRVRIVHARPRNGGYVLAAASPTSQYRAKRIAVSCPLPASRWSCVRGRSGRSCPWSWWGCISSWFGCSRRDDPIPDQHLMLGLRSTHRGGGALLAPAFTRVIHLPATCI